MADLIIKPTSGGSLKLQEDGGTDAISINTSGVSTIANASITTGTIAAATTFPSGMTIQTVCQKGVASAHETSTSTTAASSAVLTKAITARAANSHFLVTGLSFGMHCQAATSGGVHFQRAITGGATTQLYEDQMLQYNNSGGSANTASYSPVPFILYDSPSQAAGTVITYTMRYKRRAGSNTFYFVHDGWFYQLLIQEIAA